jgi:hypothetical protein
MRMTSGCNLLVALPNGIEGEVTVLANDEA